LGTSRTIAVVGLRTAPDGAWRSDVAAAARFVRTRPDAWLLGMLGAALRGGVVLLTLPILVMPTQVEVRMALGTSIGSTGLTAEFWSLVGTVTGLIVLLLLAIIYVLARVEQSAYRRLMTDPASAERRAWRNVDLSIPIGRAGFVPLLGVQATGALALLVSAVPLAAALGDAAMAELLAPTSTAALYERIAAHLAQEVGLVLAAVVLVEFVTAAATRAVLAHGHGLNGRPPVRLGWLGVAVRGVARAVVAHPVRSVANLLLGWTLFVVALAAGTALINVAWDATRAAFLSVQAASEPVGLLALVAVAALLAGCFVVALLALGLVSALRGALSGMASLR
jgi:hypothetical protein